MHSFERIFVNRSVGMENGEDGGCCCKGSSAGSRICVCVSVFLGTQYIKLFLAEEN